MTQANLKQGPASEFSSLEALKASSNGLRGLIRMELNTAAPCFSEDTAQLLKHHGVYQQDNRDTRLERKEAGLDRDYRFLVRTRLPGGQLSAEQYLLCDHFATRYGQDDLRVTSRQNFQFHGVLKKDLRALIRDLNRLAEVTTFGACGDVVRNVVAPPVADIDPRFRRYVPSLLQTARAIAKRYFPQTRSYYELWVNDEETAWTNRVAEAGYEEPFYGPQYLPRKFKIGIATEFDNSPDVFTNDIGLLAVAEGEGPTRYEVVVGGGLGYIHTAPETYARLAEPFTFVSGDALIAVLDALVKVFRDYGSRSDRYHARLKYLIADRGLDWLRTKTEEHLGAPLPPPKGVQPLGQLDYLGWTKQVQPGLTYVGLWVENGRIRDVPDGRRFKSGLRAVVERFRPRVLLTGHHCVILADIPDRYIRAVQDLLDGHGIPTDQGVSQLRRTEMACPALPLCQRAIGEAERVFGPLMQGLERAGHDDCRTIVRMSGCPNGCSRPRTAEVGLIAFRQGTYQVYVGGNVAGTRLNELLVESVRYEGLVPLLTALFSAWKAYRRDGEAFGDWSRRAGLGTLHTVVANVPQ